MNYQKKYIQTSLLLCLISFLIVQLSAMDFWNPEELPLEIWLQICENLDSPRDFKALKNSCSYLKKYIENDSAFARLQLRAALKERGYKDQGSPISMSSYFSECLKPTLPQEEIILKGHTMPVLTVIRLYNGDIASGGMDGKIIIWRMNSEGFYCKQKVLLNVAARGLKLPVSLLFQAHDGSIVSNLLDDLYGIIRLWYVNSEGVYDSDYLCIGKCAVRSITQPSASILVFGLSDGRIIVWDGKIQKKLTLDAHTDSIVSLFKLSNGDFASYSCDKTVRFWHPCRGDQDEIEYHCKAVLKGHKETVKSVILLANGNIASRTLNGEVKTWEINEAGAVCKETFKSSVFSRAYFDNVNEVTWLGLPNGDIKITSIYPKLSHEQIYLVRRLNQYGFTNKTIELDDFWMEVYKSLPRYLRLRYERVIKSFQVSV